MQRPEMIEGLGSFEEQVVGRVTGSAVSTWEGQ